MKLVIMAPKSKNKMPASTPSTGGASGQKSSSKSYVSKTVY